MDYDLVARELLRALRGTRSQVQWSRWLGYKSNVAYPWESGRRFPTAAEFLRAAARSGIDLRQVFLEFYGTAPAAFVEELDDLSSPAAVVCLLVELRGGVSNAQVAARCGRSRFAVSRWMGGKAEPRLPDFLRLIDACSLRMVDFVGTLVPPEDLPSISETWNALERRRQGAFEAPWTQAMLRALELDDYRALPTHEVGWLTRRLRLPEGEEERCLTFLMASGQVRLDPDGRYEQQVLAVDTRRHPAVSRVLKAHWAKVGVERLERGAPGQYSYNVFTVSDADFERIRELHLAYYHALRSIVDSSTEGERVAIANVQLFALDADESEL